MKYIYILIILTCFVACIKYVEPPKVTNFNELPDQKGTFQIKILKNNYVTDTSKTYSIANFYFNIDFSFNGHDPINFKGESVAGLLKGELIIDRLIHNSSSSKPDYYVGFRTPENATDKDSIKIKFTAVNLEEDTAVKYFTIYFKKFKPSLEIRASSSYKLNDTTFNIQGGSIQRINYTSSTSIGLKNIEFYEEIDGIKRLISGFPIYNISKLNYENYFNYEMNNIGKKVQLIGIITDFNNDTDTAIITLLNKAPNIATKPNNFLGAKQNLAYGSYYNSTNDVVYKSINNFTNLSDIDITYAFIKQAPFLLSTASRTDTSNQLNEVYSVSSSICLFGETNFTAAQFDTITSKYINTINLPITGSQKVKIETGKVYTYMNEKGKKGVIKIVSIVSGLDGYIIIDLKTQAIF